MLTDLKEGPIFFTEDKVPKLSHQKAKITIASKLDFNVFKSNLHKTESEPAYKKKAGALLRRGIENDPLSIHIGKDLQEQFEGITIKKQFAEDQGSLSAGLKKKQVKPRLIQIGKLRQLPRDSVDSTDFQLHLVLPSKEAKADRKLVKLGSFSDKDEPVPLIQHSSNQVLNSLVADKISRSKLA